MDVNFKDWLSVQETARSSMAHTMGKFQGNLNRPVAVLSAFRGDVPAADDAERLAMNRKANEALKSLFRSHGLSFYPVIGMGQEPDSTGAQKYNKEESFVAQPIDQQMGEEDFVNIIKQLLFNPTGAAGTNPHTQWGALVKLPSQKKAFLLHHDGDPVSPDSYNSRSTLNKSARPRRGKDMTVAYNGRNFPVGPDVHFTQMAKGPEASDDMKNDLDAGTKPGRRFTIAKNRWF